MVEDKTPYSHHFTTHGWEVEARVASPNAQALGDQIFDNRWKRVNFTKVAPPFGVPNSALYGETLSQCGLLAYEQAQALRWWFHAHVPFLVGLETRLVAYKVKSDVEWRRVSEQEVIDERPGCHQPLSESAE